MRAKLPALKAKKKQEKKKMKKKRIDGEELDRSKAVRSAAHFPLCASVSHHRVQLQLQCLIKLMNKTVQHLPGGEGGQHVKAYREK